MAQKAYAIRLVVNCIVTHVDNRDEAIEVASGCVEATNGTFYLGGHLTIVGVPEAEATETEVG